MNAEPAELVGVKGTAESWTDLRSGAYAQYADAGPVGGGQGYDGTHAWNEDASGVVWDERRPRGALRRDRYRLHEPVSAVVSRSRRRGRHVARRKVRRRAPLPGAAGHAKGACRSRSGSTKRRTCRCAWSRRSGSRRRRRRTVIIATSAVCAYRSCKQSDTDGNVRRSAARARFRTTRLRPRGCAGPSNASPISRCPRGRRRSFELVDNPRRVAGDDQRQRPVYVLVRYRWPEHHRRRRRQTTRARSGGRAAPAAASVPLPRPSSSRRSTRWASAARRCANKRSSSARCTRDSGCRAASRLTG